MKRMKKRANLAFLAMILVLLGVSILGCSKPIISEIALLSEEDILQMNPNKMSLNACEELCYDRLAKCVSGCSYIDDEVARNRCIRGCKSGTSACLKRCRK